MIKFIILAIMLTGLVECHIINSVAIKKLKTQVGELTSDQDDIYQMLSILETNLTDKIDKVVAGAKITTSLTSEPVARVSTDEEFEERLATMEKNVQVIKNYLMGEKKIDMTLQMKSEKVVEEMKDKVKETEVLIGGLKDAVHNSLDDFELMIRDVNTSAHLSVNVEGVVYYGGIGSACSDQSDECLLNNTECREWRCQCLPGLGYDWKNKACVDSCTTYGSKYQSVNNRIIRGFNNLVLEEVAGISECKQRCIDETGFVCKTIDYFPRWSTCYLSDKVKSDADEDAWEYNSVGRHFQRDCE